VARWGAGLGAAASGAMSATVAVSAISMRGIVGGVYRPPKSCSCVFRIQ
jgi:hypothetical protein